MIPEHLQGKKAEQIIDEQRKRFEQQSNILYLTVDQYVCYLESFLLIAVKDALCNADKVKELVQEGGYQAQQRAIAFLNMVLPYEDKNIL